MQRAGQGNRRTRQSKLYNFINKIIIKLKSNNDSFSHIPTVIPIAYITCNWDILFNNIQEFNSTHNSIKTYGCYCREIPDGIIIVWNNSWIKYNCPACKRSNVFHILHIGSNNYITIMIYITNKLSLIPMHICYFA